MLKVSSIWACVVALVGLTAITTAAQAPTENSQVAASNIEKNAPIAGSPVPHFREIRKATIGMSADALRDLWGKPKVEDKDGFVYELSDSETAQVVIDADKKITAIAMTYTKGKGSPGIADVFGPGISPQKQANGSVYHMVRYPAAGYWVSYHMGPGENAAVTLTMRKL